MTAPAFTPHDHRACARDALAHADATCRKRGQRLTESRRRVLEILLEEHRPLGAYELLDRLSTEGRTAQPPVAYRALDFLVANGLAHRLHSLNAFVACTAGSTGHSPLFLICEGCGQVAEADALPVGKAIEKAARASGFAAEVPIIEAQGTCAACRNGGDAGC